MNNETEVELSIQKDINSKYDQSLKDFTKKLLEEAREQRSKTDKRRIIVLGMFTMDNLNMFYGGYLDRTDNRFYLTITLDEQWFNEYKANTLNDEDVALLSEPVLN